VVGGADADLAAEARIGEVLDAGQPLRHAGLAVIHDDAGALGDAEPEALRVAQVGGDAALEHLAAHGLQHAGLLRAGEAGGVHRDQHVGGLFAPSVWMRWMSWSASPSIRRTRMPVSRVKAS
jgi:hypothetical protein